MVVPVLRGVAMIPGCTCHGFHTDSVDRAITDDMIRTLIRMEPCPVERDKLRRILARRTR